MKTNRTEQEIVTELGIKVKEGNELIVKLNSLLPLWNKVMNEHAQEYYKKYDGQQKTKAGWATVKKQAIKYAEKQMSLSKDPSIIEYIKLDIESGRLKTAISGLEWELKECLRALRDAENASKGIFRWRENYTDAHSADSMIISSNLSGFTGTEEQAQARREKLESLGKVNINIEKIAA